MDESSPLDELGADGRGRMIAGDCMETGAAGVAATAGAVADGTGGGDFSNAGGGMGEGFCAGVKGGTDCDRAGGVILMTEATDGCSGKMGAAGAWATTGVDGCRSK